MNKYILRLINNDIFDLKLKIEYVTKSVSKSSPQNLEFNQKNLNKLIKRQEEAIKIKERFLKQISK
jgi:predicted nucleic acid-binding Zn ribbon protein